MPDFRAFCSPADSGSPQLTLSAAESHHLVVVNRARVGDPVVAFDGQGREWQTQVALAHKHAAVLRVLSAQQRPKLPYALTLGQALPKGGVMDAIVRKATEIGVARIVPLESDRTQVHLAGERSEKKNDKWQLAALEAAKQCGNPFVPEIASVQNVRDFLAAGATCELKVIASLRPEATSLKPVLASYRQRFGGMPATVACLVGPEGDFSPEEYAQAAQAGFAPITLGPLVLRSETAAVYVLSVLSYELQAGVA